MDLLIDADSLLYKFAAVNQADYDWGDGVTSTMTSLDQAITDLEDFIQEIRDETMTNEYFMYLTGPTNFRYDILPTYKHNRKNNKKPILLEPLRTYLIKNHPVSVTSKIEADDACVIMMTREPGKFILAHIDKDLDQAPGTHYNWNTMDTYEVSKGDAEYFFYYQVLTGDSTDGYSGCRGIGPKKAAKILQDVYEECALWASDDELNIRRWEAIVKTYREKGYTEEDALQQARVAKMLDNSLWTGKDVILWTPPKYVGDVVNTSLIIETQTKKMG